MIEFAYPWAFLLLLPVFALPMQARLTGRNMLAVPKLSDRTHTLTPRLALAWLPSALQVLGLALVVVALARPRVTRNDIMVESDGLDIILALDTSGSMSANDLSPQLNRLQVAKKVMADFITERPYDRIGVVLFGEEAYTHVPLTLDHDTLAGIMERVDIGDAGARGTAIGSAVAVSAKRLKDLDAPSRLVLLLTDGHNNAGTIGPLEAAQAAAALGIKVYTIGVGQRSRRTSFGAMDSSIDEAGLTRVAEITGAQYFRATNENSLQQIYATINELETSPAEVIQLVDHEERFRDFLVPGMGLLALQLLLSATWLRRGP